MNLDQVHGLIEASDPDRWKVLPGYPMPQRFIITTGSEGLHLEDNIHYGLATYVPNVSLSLAWGLTENAEFAEEWHQQGGFPNRTAQSIWVDTLWNGFAIDREIGVVVDGSRAILPLPVRIVEGNATIAWEITPWEDSFFRLIDRLAGHHEYDSYRERARFFVKG